MTHKKNRLPTPVDLTPLPNLFALRVDGDCMAPLLEDGGCVVVDKRAPPRPGDLVVLHFRQEVPAGVAQLQVKRLVLLPPHFVSFLWTDDPRSDIAAAMVVETLNPPSRRRLECSRLMAVHYCERMPPAAVFLKAERSWQLPPKSETRS